MKMMIFPWKWWFSHENDDFPMKMMLFPWKRWFSHEKPSILGYPQLWCDKRWGFFEHPICSPTQLRLSLVGSSQSPTSDNMWMEINPNGPNDVEIPYEKSWFRSGVFIFVGDGIT